MTFFEQIYIIDLPKQQVLPNKKDDQMPFLPDPRGAGLHLAIQFSYVRTEQASNRATKQPSKRVSFVSRDQILVPKHSLRDKGTKVQHRNIGTKGQHRNKGTTQEQRKTGTKEQRNNGTKQTKEQRNLGTW